MDQTPHLNLPIPNADAVPPTNISDEFPRIAMALVMLDFIIHTLQGVVAGKAEADHTHAISTITGLTEALASKMPANASFSLDSLSDVQGAADALVNYVLVKKPTGQWEPSTALAALGIHNHAISEIVGLTEQLLDIINALDTLAATKAARLSDGASDDTYADTSEIGYVDGTIQKRGTFLGLISSIFNGTRAIANGVFLSASFAWQNATGFKRTHNITGHTANRATNWPNRDIDFETLGVTQSSGQLTVTAGGLLQFTHTLGAPPKRVSVDLVCIGAENGWAVGDVLKDVGFAPTVAGSTASNANGPMRYIDPAANPNTVVSVRWGNTGSSLLTWANKTTGAGANLTYANWRAVINVSL